MANRKKNIQLVHVGANKLFCDEDARRGWQQDRTGHRSCSKMTDDQLEGLVAELRDKGALDSRPPKHAGTAPHNLDKVPQLKKIEAQLADMKLPWSYANAIAKRMFGIARVDWLREQKQRDAIIAALHVEQEKRTFMNNINASLKVINKGLSYIDTLVPEHMRGVKWQRNRAWLAHISAELMLAEQAQKEGRANATLRGLI